MAKYSDVEVGDLVIVSDPTHTFRGTVFKITGKSEKTASLFFLPEYNPERLDYWNKKGDYGANLYYSRIELYYVRDINFIE